uniref:Uncharacterized protein AlNc14C100G6012 n=1 Tax=Albugo laibachii Nc14 TaxID=890382 RepID=F0WHE9_9STRA|nr:conserved hypothetical protein [Albugo laibachii Nc14]|eukprot:CCA20668.1 conserved hypothetical protein [Albugo laibachii Nc14]
MTLQASTPSRAAPEGWQKHVLEEVHLCQDLINDVTSALLHTILFTRAPGPVRPSECTCSSLPSITYALCGVGDVTRKVEFAVRSFEKRVQLALTTAPMVATSRSGVTQKTCFGYIKVTFLERKVKKALFGLMSNEEKLIFEEWIVPMRVEQSTCLVDPLDHAKVMKDTFKQTESQVQHCLLQIITLVQKIEQIPATMYDFEITHYGSTQALATVFLVKGGQVDYGKGHAEKYKHTQAGRHHNGLYKSWGTTINGKINKVHFIGHSMGGPTLRMLAHLLYHGVKNTTVESMVDESHPFYHGGKDWIDSITFLESPLTGVILADVLRVIQHLAYPTLRIGEYIYPIAGFDFDLHFDQWKVNDWKSLRNYFEWSLSNLLGPDQSLQDSAAYSLTTTGAAEENKWIKNVDILHFG